MSVSGGPAPRRVPTRWRGPCRTLRLLAAALLIPAGAATAAESCPASAGVSVQVLGSGGPVADDGRASSAYLVWVDGRARVLVDIGGGAMLRFAQAGADFRDLDAVLLTHLHADHSAGLPALLKSGYFAGRERSLVLAGPSARGPFPSVEDFLAALLQPGSGAFAYLGGYLDGTGGLPYLRVVTVEIEDDEDDEDGEDDEYNEDSAAAADDDEDLDISRIALRDSPLGIEAAGGSHGPVPALFYRVEAAGRSIVFAGDHDGRGDSLAEFAEDADVLVAHLPIPEDADARIRALHAIPSRVGELADEAEVEQLVLSHFMAPSLADLDAAVSAVRARYDGPMLLAEDLSCLTLP
jgi:ribonuclease BN (tRNA processing enzyme)